MKSIDEILPILKDIMTGLSKQFGENCEFVIHDYSKPFNSTIVAICNGKLTGRKVGKGGTTVGLRVLQGLESSEGKFNYISQTKDGRLLRSSTIYLKDDKNKVIGSMCINYDITDMINIKKSLNKICDIDDLTKPKVDTTMVYDKVEDMLIDMIQESISYVGIPVVNMTREQKVKGIQYLNKKGALRIKNAGNIIAKYYDISRYSVYNYINDNIE